MKRERACLGNRLGAKSKWTASCPAGLFGLCFVFIQVVSCGYSLVGMEQNLPAGLNSIGIPLMQNNTAEPGLEDLLTQELRRQFLEQGGVQLLPCAQAEACLEGTILEVKTSPVSYSEQGKISLARVEISARFKLVHRGSGETVWESGEMKAAEDYPVTRDPLVNEQMRRVALQEAGEELTETLRELLLAGF